MKKRAFMLLLFELITIISFVSADKIEITPANEVFAPGEKITFKVSVYDELGMPISTNVRVVLEDAEKTRTIEQNINTNEFVDISLGENAPSGYWKLTAKYNDIESSAVFMVEVSELAKFELIGDVLTVTNIGNVRYTKTIQIVIGDSIGTKQMDLEIGEKASFRLVAPPGNYNVKISDGKTTISQGNVALTGKVIGILDATPLSQSPITASMEDKDNPYAEESTPFLRNKILAYVFVLIVIAGAILLAIERHYKNRAHLSEY